MAHGVASPLSLAPTSYLFMHSFEHYVTPWGHLSPHAFYQHQSVAGSSPAPCYIPACAPKAW